jgi:AP endonuclease-1
VKKTPNKCRHVVPHGSYLVNLAQEDPTKAKQAYDAFLDDLKRCEALGIKLYNIHPGNTNGGPRAAAIGRIAEALNRAHQATTNVQPLLENMAGAGNVVGTTFEDLRDIIAGVADKSRIGVCLDTCHAFAAGYDLRTPAAFADTLDRFDRIVGLRYLRALHLNDSKAPLGSHRDLHQNIGLGFLGLRAFHSVMNQRGFEGLPMVLETPTEVPGPDGKVTEDRGVWAREIKLLESLIGMDAAGEEFQALERELAERGRPEREKHAEQFERKQEKDKRAAGKGKGAAQRKKKGEEGGESE